MLLLNGFGYAFPMLKSFTIDCGSVETVTCSNFIDSMLKPGWTI